jgi:DNA-binding MarR family transcriptional regulator
MMKQQAGAADVRRCCGNDTDALRLAYIELVIVDIPRKMTEVPVNDPTERSRWGAMRLLWAVMTADVDRVYIDAELCGLEDQLVMELVRLHTCGPMTVSDLARSVERSPAKVSRKVTAMEAADLVTTTAAADDLARTVAVTAKTKRLVDRLIAEWEATESTIAEVEAETPYPLSRAFADLETVLQRKSFHDRILEKLAKDPRWSTVK